MLQLFFKGVILLVIEHTVVFVRVLNAVENNNVQRRGVLFSITENVILAINCFYNEVFKYLRYSRKSVYIPMLQILKIRYFCKYGCTYINILTGGICLCT